MTILLVGALIKVMPPPTLLRTKSFWLGLLAVVGFAWAWADTRFHETGLTFGGPLTAYQVARLDGATVFVIGPTGKVAAREGWEFLRGANSSQRKSWEEFWTSVGAHHFTLHDGAVFFPLLAAWLGWLAWRCRWQRRAPDITPE